VQVRHPRMVGYLHTIHPRPTGMTRFSENGTTVYQNAPAESLDLEDSTLKDGSSDRFLSLYPDELLGVISHITAKNLINRDFIILMVYVIHADWRTGRCRLTVKKVGEILGHKVQTVQPCIKRLVKQNLIVPIEDPKTGEKLYIISPSLLKVGSGQSRGFLLKTYYDAINRNQPDTLDPAGNDLEDTGYFDEL
jgi:hypothetical protein